MDFPPWLKVHHFPSLSLGIMPLLNLAAVNIAGWVYLIKKHIYMMPQFNICRMSRYTIGDHPNPKHNLTKSMVGPWPLAPHHDYLQYMHHVHLMQRGQNRGVTKYLIYEQYHVKEIRC